MQHMCEIEVIDKKVFPDFQEKFLADPKSGACPFYHIGDKFTFRRYGDEDTFWTVGKGSQCAEAWDCISRYVYTALQGGSIMRNWTNDERMMIACCNDGTRPVIFKIRRIDYFAVYIAGVKDSGCAGADEVDINAVKKVLSSLEGIISVELPAGKNFFEVVIDSHNPNINVGKIRDELKNAGYTLEKID